MTGTATREPRQGEVNEMNDIEANNTDTRTWIANLRDHDGMTREHARKNLAKLGPAVTPLLLPLLEDKESQTRWEAAKALSRIADPASIEALLPVLEDDDTDVAWVAAEALAAIGPPAVAPLLQMLLDRFESIGVRQGAHHVLGELRKSKIGDKIAKVYAALDSSDPDIEVISAAERALIELK